MTSGRVTVTGGPVGLAVFFCSAFPILVLSALEDVDLDADDVSVAGATHVHPGVLHASVVDSEHGVDLVLLQRHSLLDALSVGLVRL